MSRTTEPPWLAAVTADPGVGDAAVLGGATGGPASVLLVPQGFQPGPVLRRLVRSAAPSYEPPPQVVLTQSVPRVDGALDLPAAREIVRTSPYRYWYEPAATPAEAVLLAEVQTLFPDLEISVTDSLADLGGDSLTAIQLAEQLEQRHGTPLDPSALFAAGTFRDLAATLRPGV